MKLTVYIAAVIALAYGAILGIGLLAALADNWFAWAYIIVLLPVGVWGTAQVLFWLIEREAP